MNNFFVFLKKELKEFVKTWKLLILLAFFLANSLMSPVLAYITPKLLEMIGMTGPGLEGLAPNLQNFYSQYYGNQFQSGFLSLIFITCLAVVREKQKGTAILTLTKNISRPTFVIAKYVSYVFWYTVIYIISYIPYAIMTKILINEGISKDALISLGVFYIMGLMFASSAILASCIGKNTLISCLISLGIYAVMYILSAIPYVNRYTPAMLVNNSVMIVTGDYSYLLIPMISCIVCTLLFIVIGIMSFEKQEL